jgi:hypothetical protein
MVHQARFRGRRPAGGPSGAQGWTSAQARAAASGLASRPWWAGSVAGAGASAERDTAGPGVDAAAAADLYGRTPSGPAATEAAESNGANGANWAAGADGADGSDGWLDGAALAEGEVDEGALAAALAADELADITPEEIARLEAGLDIDADSDDSADSAGPSGDDVTEIDANQIDEEQER